MLQGVYNYVDGALLRLRGMPATESDGGMEAPESIDANGLWYPLWSFRSAWVAIGRLRRSEGALQVGCVLRVHVLCLLNSFIALLDGLIVLLQLDVCSSHI